MKLPCSPSCYRNVGAVILLLMAGALVFGADAAHAGDGKLYPGSLCVRWSGGTVVYNWSMIGNAHATSALKIDCPVVRDIMGGDIDDGVVRAIDRHFSEDVRCNLVSVYVNSNGGFSFWSSGNKETEGTSVAPKEIPFGSVGAGSKSHYYYSCRIPPRYSGHTSYLISYRVDED